MAKKFERNLGKKFERNLDAATDSTLIEPNWDGILKCVGNIRSGDVTPKAALASIQKRIHSENPHTAVHALLTLEECVKNCDASFHKEIATKSFMKDMRNLAIEGPSEPIRQKVLELIQCWSADLVFGASFHKLISVTSLSDGNTMMTLAGKLLKHCLAQKQDVPNLIYYLLTVGLYWPQYEVRRHAETILKTVLVENRVQFLTSLFEYAYTAIVDNGFDQVLQKPYSTYSDKYSETDKRFEIPGKTIRSFAVMLFKLLKPEDITIVNLRKLMVPALSICSLQRTVEYDGALWIKTVHRFCPDGIDVFFSDDSFCGDLVERVFATKQFDVKINMIRLLIAEGDSNSYMNKAIWEKVDAAISSIAVDDYFHIPDEDYDVYNAQEGVLYNVNVIDENSDEKINANNLRRENKAYSFKEQQAEIQLRKELAEKKRAEGKLTKQQEKAVANELKKETELRNQLKALANDAKERLDILAAAVHANPTGALQHFQLYNIVISLLPSQLVSQYAVECFLAFRDAAFDPSDDFLHEIVAHSSLRVLKSYYLFDEWSAEALNDQIGRTLVLLSSLCMDFGDEEVDIDSDFDLYRETMSVAKLCFVLPLLKTIVCSSQWPDSLKCVVVNFIKDAVRKSFVRQDEIRYLAIVDYSEMLLTLIGSHEYAHIFDSCDQSLQNMAEIVELADAKETDIGLRFYRNLIRYLPHRDSDERRILVLRALSKLSGTMTALREKDQSWDFTHRIFVAKFDSVVEVKSLAELIYEEFKLVTRPELYLDLLKDVEYEKINRGAVPAALKELLTQYPTTMSETLDKLKECYEESKKPAGGNVDQFGRVISEAKDQSSVRIGYAFCFLALANVITAKDSLSFLPLVVPDGLQDVDSECRATMLKAATKAISRFGEINMNDFLPFLEKQLDELTEAAEHDILREGLVILLGTLAKDLDEGNPKMAQIFARLISTLSTPSQQVQESVAKCISPLVRLMQDGAKELLQHLLKLLLSDSTYGERRGAAYGIAGIVKGLGLHHMRDLELMDVLESALEDKKSAKRREGGLMALETLSRALGNLFEPYLLTVIGDLLTAFGDSNESVRRSADDASRAMMSILSIYGIKLTMPAILIALDDDSWRTKCASVNLLGSMAYCAPQQLSSCLPSVVPHLIEVLADSHIKVRASGEQALKQIAQVIRNPEILSVSSHLLGGLIDPAEKTLSCLEIIVNTKFIHYIDSPSLALIMPIIRRAFSDRSTETRRMAGQIIANIYSLTEHKDMEPYLGDLIPGLKNSLMDPVPEVRAVSAKALGAIVAFSSQERSETLCAELIPWLKENLVSPTSTVDRSGAAQGLSEVLAGLGEDHLKNAMPDIIRTTESPAVEPHVRDGYILMYIYLPIVFGETFVQFLSEIVPSILKALADENEYVRHSALRAGQRLIQTYVSQAKKLLLPELQRALFDNNWRIRHAAVTLIGDFLFNISGVSGKMTTDTAGDDDTMGMESASKVIARTLGPQMRDNILAGLYLSRSDVSLNVRQAAAHVWKVVVTNTPRTVKEIMKPLFEGLLSSLSSDSEDRQLLAARCLEELVRKMGERLIIDVLPVLREALSSPDDRTRLGASAALNEIITNVPRETVQFYVDDIVPLFATTLKDQNEAVRRSTAKTFNSFFHSVGPSALDLVVTPLYGKFIDTKDSVILDSLCALMQLNGRRMLPFLLPKLSQAPVDIQALCKLTGAAAQSLNSLEHHIEVILKALVGNFENITDEDLKQCLPLVKAIGGEEDGLPFVSCLFEQALADGHVTAVRILSLFLENTKIDKAPLLEAMVPSTLILYTSTDPAMVDAAITVMAEIGKILSGTSVEHILIVQSAISSVVRHSTQRKVEIAGLNNQLGVKPLLTCLREGILSGAVDVKELAGISMGRLVENCSPEALKPHMISVTGPLIRILGDRFSSAVKIAILNILSTLLDKSGMAIRPFMPQLQSTILKAMQDTSSSDVRISAGKAMARLLKIHVKPDAVSMEIVKFVSNSEDEEMKENARASLKAILENVEDRLSADTVMAIKGLVTP